MKHSEDKLQAACVRWFRLQYPDVVIFSIPNGGQRNAVTGALMKATGTLAGVADLFVMKAGRINHIEITEEGKYFDYDDYNGLFIEMKSGKNGQTEAQKLFQQQAEQAGYKYAVCRSFDEFEKVVNKYLDK